MARRVGRVPLIGKSDITSLLNRKAVRGTLRGGVQGRGLRPRRPISYVVKAVLPCALFLGVFLVLLGQAGNFLAKSDPQRPADAALVFSGDPGYERTKEAVKLYKEQWVKKIVLTGSGGPGDGALSLRGVAVREGVRPEDILLENRSTSTYTNLLNSREIILSQGFTSVLLVSSPYHLRRVWALARRVFQNDTVHFMCHPVSHSYWRPDKWWEQSWERRVLAREYVRLAAFWLFGAYDRTHGGFLWTRFLSKLADAGHAGYQNAIIDRPYRRGDMERDRT